ncbi:nucleotidyltransferase family protein [Flagellimonas sp.]|uniref:nucleotidyltransferase family protein n=1 Tax=Flagellimonas sp. TaxID=2058762 RepID=UPI003B507B35
MANMSNTIPILILAAGASSRMKGEIKQLLPWGNSTLLGNAINQAKKVSNAVYVVLGANADKILEVISINADIIHNPNWETGMGSSISCGIKHIQKKENPKAVLIMLADQPLIDAVFLNELIQKFINGSAEITATIYKNKAGVPSIFDSSLFPELMNLASDVGARTIVEKHAGKTNLVDPNGKEIDIDTKEKYNQLLDK